jgi:hypothetical protein
MLKFQSHFFCAASQTLHPHTMSTSSIASIAQLVVNLFIDPTVNGDEYDDVVEEVVDKEMEVTRDYFLKLGFTDTPTKHSLRSRHDLREIPDKNTIRNNFEKLSVSKFNLFYPATPRTHPFFLIAH